VLECLNLTSSWFPNIRTDNSADDEYSMMSLPLHPVDMTSTVARYHVGDILPAEHSPNCRLINSKLLLQCPKMYSSSVRLC